MSKNIVTMNELIEEYARIIDGQNQKIRNLVQELEEVKDQVDFYKLECEKLDEIQDFPDYLKSVIKEQKQEIKQLRVALSQIAHIVGGAVLPTASLQFITEEVEKEVELVVTDLRADNEHLRKRIEKLSKRKPTEEEALAQYHWLKENSSRNKN